MQVPPAFVRLELNVMEVHIAKEIQQSVREGPQRVFGGRQRSRDHTLAEARHIDAGAPCRRAPRALPGVPQGPSRGGFEGNRRLTPGADGITLIATLVLYRSRFLGHARHSAPALDRRA